MVELEAAGGDDIGRDVAEARSDHDPTEHRIFARLIACEQFGAHAGRRIKGSVSRETDPRVS